jgi:transcriptional regulator with XRE-family HTH domain
LPSPDLATKILRRRKRLGFSQEHVADLADLSVKGYQRVERGEVSPRVVTLLRIAAALRTTGAALLEGVTSEAAGPDAERAAVPAS